MDISEVQDKLVTEMESYAEDPLGWVMFAFPWGEDQLEGFTGPEDWQAEVLLNVKEGLIDVNEAIRIATASIRPSTVLPCLEAVMKTSFGMLSSFKPQ